VGRTQLKQEKTGDRNMEEIKQILLELSREVKEMRNDISQNNKEMKSLREDVRIMQVNWEKEKLDLVEKITKTEEKIEKLEKDKIRNNLIVTGMRMETEDEELLRNTMEKKINKELSLNVKVKKVYKIGQDRYNVEMNNWNKKLMVLKTKGKLRGKEIYIDSALTLTEGEIQKKIRDFAKKERINGATVRVKYQGVEIDGRSWKWNKKEQKLMKVGEIKAPKN
jgi:thiol:disulfide interchange protein